MSEQKWAQGEAWLNGDADEPRPQFSHLAVIVQESVEIRGTKRLMDTCIAEPQEGHVAANAERIRDLWNACASIPNPAAIAKVVGALESCKALGELDAEEYGTLVTDGIVPDKYELSAMTFHAIRDTIEQARQALAELNQQEDAK